MFACFKEIDKMGRDGSSKDRKNVLRPFMLNYIIDF